MKDLTGIQGYCTPDPAFSSRFGDKFRAYSEAVQNAPTVTFDKASKGALSGLDDDVDPKAPPPEWLEKYYSRVTFQGQLLSVKQRLFTRLSGGTRGKITEFSPVSQRQLQSTFAKVSVLGGTMYFLTVTFSDRSPVWDDCPTSEDKMLKSKKIVHSFFTTLSRKGISGLWVMEKTAKGIPHYHIMVKVPGDLPLGDYFEYDDEIYLHHAKKGQFLPDCDWSKKDWPGHRRLVNKAGKKQSVHIKNAVPGVRLLFQKTWASCATGLFDVTQFSGDLRSRFIDSFEAGVDVQVVEKHHALTSYFSKYLSKKQDDAKGYQKENLVGRIWGVFNRKRFLAPEETYFVPHPMVDELQEQLGSMVLSIYGLQNDGAYRRNFIVLNNDDVALSWLRSNATIHIRKMDAYIRKNGFNVVKESIKRCGKKGLRVSYRRLALVAVRAALDVHTGV